MTRFCLLLLFVCWTRAQQWDPCSSLNLCLTTHENGPECGCDAACYTYGDCCTDAPPGFPQPGLGPELFECGAEDFYRIVRCPNGTPKHLKELCESERPEDPSFIAMVTDNRKGYIYRNIHCSRCHGVPDSDLVYWYLLVFCPDVDEKTPYNQTSLSDVLFYSRSHGDWGVKDDVKGFKRCYLNLEPPADSRFGRRYCRGGFVADCPDTWDDPVVHQRCRTYYSPVMVTVDRPALRLYKNVHCSICHGDYQNYHQMCAVSPKVPFGGYRGCRGGSNKLTVPPLCILFDMNPGNGPEVGRAVSCPDGQVVFSGSCKKLECVLPGFRMVDGECVLGRS